MYSLRWCRCIVSHGLHVTLSRLKKRNNVLDTFSVHVLNIQRFTQKGSINIQSVYIRNI